MPINRGSKNLPKLSDLTLSQVHLPFCETVTNLNIGGRSPERSGPPLTLFHLVGSLIQIPRSYRRIIGANIEICDLIFFQKNNAEAIQHPRI